MTSETRTYIETTDIEGIEFQCGSCKTTVTVPIAKSSGIHVPSKCPNCKEQLIEEGSPYAKRIDEFLRNLRYATDPEMGFGVAVRLRIKLQQ